MRGRHLVAKNKKKVAVMGAGGYVGRHLVRAMSSRHRVEPVIIPRDGLAPLYSQHDMTDHMDDYPFEYFYLYDDEVPGDSYYHELQDDDLREVMCSIEEADVLVNLAGSGRQSARNPYHESVEKSAAVASFLARQVGAPIVHLSGLGASAGSPVAYLAAKYRAELHIRKSGTRRVIFRPSYIVGGGDHLSSYVAGAAPKGRGGRTRRHPGADAPPAVDVYNSPRAMQPIHIDDAVSLIMWAVRTLLKPRRPARQKGGSAVAILDMVGPDKIPFYDYMSALAENAGAAARPISMEQAYARALRDPESAPFGVDDLGIITGGYTGNYQRLVEATGVRPRSVLHMLEAGRLP